MRLRFNRTARIVPGLLPDALGVDQYTGAPDGSEDGEPNLDGPIRESESLPEDRFHRADMVSQHMIDAREKQRKDKVSGSSIST